MRAVARAAAGGSLSAGWDACAFPRGWRRFQVQALEVAEQAQARGQRTLHLVLPPGTGKTAVGLEIARRRARSTLVLVPNTAVQGQWLAEWESFAPEGAACHPVPGSAQRELGALTVLTYQTLTVWDRPDSADDPDSNSERVREQRRAAVRGDGDLLALLHPAGRELIERAARRGPWLVVLDECHHLLETWGALAQAVVEALGPDTLVVGLTATPPAELTSRQRALSDALLGPVDLAVPLPAVVKEGDLAPYQELAFYVTPTAEEDTWIAAERTRFADLQLALVEARSGTLPFAEWLRRRLEVRSTGEDGLPLSWRAFEVAEPDLARAGLRLVASGLVRLPEGARLREEHRVPPDADDWSAVLGAYAVEQLVPSPAPQDAALLEQVRAVLPGLGRRLTRAGLRAAASPVDRVCALSAAKASAAMQVLDAEHAALGDELRALVLCDYEDEPAQTPSSLRATGGIRSSGSARLALLALSLGELGTRLRPVLVTGRRVAAAHDVAHDLRRWCTRRGVSGLRCVPLEGTVLFELVTDRGAWSSRTWTPLVTAYLESGRARVLVGTRALLGEGWDCPSVSVVVDLTSAATPTAVTQLRGRGLRRDPARPGKVADAWTVVCVADGHPRGDADHLRAARKHAFHLALDADGEISSGIGHCDPALGPYTAPDAQLRAEVNARALARPAERAAVRAGWRVGEPYRGEQVAALQVRWERDLGLAASAAPAALLRPGRLLGAEAPAGGSSTGPAPLWPAPLMAGTLCGGVGAAAVDTATGVGAGAGTALLVAGLLGSLRYRQQTRAVRDSPPTAALEQLAAVVADALHAVEDTARGAEALLFRPDEEGWLRCELDGVPRADSAAFAEELDELLAPLGEPRWLVARLVLPSPVDDAARRRLALSRALGRSVEAAVAWHAVPGRLARSDARLAAFAAAWEQRVGPARLVRARDPEGLALLDLLHGADPFEVTSQLRTVWR